jgi:hypothetical protein
MGTENSITQALLSLIDEDRAYKEWLRVSEFRDITEEVRQRLEGCRE